MRSPHIWTKTCEWTAILAGIWPSMYAHRHDRLKMIKTSYARAVPRKWLKNKWSQLIIWIGLREMPSFQWLAVKCKGRQGSTNICLSFWYGIQHLKVAGGPRSLSALHDSKPESRIAYKKHANNYSLKYTDFAKGLCLFPKPKTWRPPFFSCPGGFSKSFYCKEGPSWTVW